ncbi:MAG: efflux RND transporter periplasmic adaptor subunit [Planctomycetota bacterium]|jgi:RND family efflux transporter MFP subunit
MRFSYWAMSLGILVLTLSGCGSGEHSHEDQAAGTREAPGERPTIAVTNWTERSELFTEYPVLVAGERGRFAIHVTDLSDFRPLTTGEAVVVLRGQDGAETEFRGGLSRPGIFGADVTPPAPGVFDMSLRIHSPDLQDVHELGSVTVLGPGSPIPTESEEESEGISFLKEQQWTLEFGTEPVTVRSLQPSLVVPGTVRPRAGGEAVLSAPVSGRIDPSSDVPVSGRRVRAGIVLARIVPRSDDIRDAAGLRADLVDAEQQYELARQEHERAARLVESRALPARRLTEAGAGVAASKARLDAARQRMKRLGALSQSGEPVRGDDWFAIRAPFDGVVAEVHYASGASVEEGDFLLRLVETDRVHVVGAVPESRVSTLRAVGNAELLRDGQAPVSLDRAVVIGDVVEPTARTVEVRYALDNRALRLPVGRGVRLRLFIGKAESLPAVPESAIVDDGGRPVVFVQTGGESFERRPVRLGSREGGYVHVLEGVEPGERMVSRGAYLIRLAAMSTQIPAHGHVH